MYEKLYWNIASDDLKKQQLNNKKKGNIWEGSFLCEGRYCTKQGILRLQFNMLACHNQKANISSCHSNLWFILITCDKFICN